MKSLLIILLLSSCAKPNNFTPPTIDIPNQDKFNHTIYQTECTTCHDKKERPPTHPTDTVCNGCHIAGTNWKDFKFHKDGSNCYTCHSNQMPIGIVNRFDHNIGAVVDCKECHTNPGNTFAGATYNHNPIPNKCNPCHLPDQPMIIVRPFFKHSTSIAKGMDCYTCHITGVGNIWKDVQFNHSQRGTLGCTDCHTSHSRY